MIFRKSQNRIQEPALLRKLIVDLIGSETWSIGGDLNGDAADTITDRLRNRWLSSLSRRLSEQTPRGQHEPQTTSRNE